MDVFLLDGSHYQTFTLPFTVDIASQKISSSGDSRIYFVDLCGTLSMIDSVLRRTSQIHIHVIRNFEAGFLISASMDGPGNIYIASSGTRYAYKLSPPAHDYCQTLLRVPHIECDSSVATLFYDETNERLAVICVDKVDFIGINNRNILT